MKDVIGELEREYRVSHKGNIGILHDTFHLELSEEDSRALIEKRGLQDHHDALNAVSSSLDGHPAVMWHSYQTPLKRAKRDVVFNDPVYNTQWHLVCVSGCLAVSAHVHVCLYVCMYVCVCNDVAVFLSRWNCTHIDMPENCHK